LQNELPRGLPMQLHNACREIAFQVMELLGIEVDDGNWLDAQDPERLAAKMPGALLQMGDEIHAA
jgi:hypothetical protein